MTYVQSVCQWNFGICPRPCRYRSWALCAYSATTSESLSNSSKSGPHKTRAGNSCGARLWNC